MYAISACVLRLRLSVHKVKFVYAIACEMKECNTYPAPLSMHCQDILLLFIVCLILRACMWNDGLQKAMVDESSLKGSLKIRFLCASMVTCHRGMTETCMILL